MEQCGTEPIGSYDLSKKFLLSKLKIRRSEKFFLHAEKRIMDMLFWLDCLNIVLKDHKSLIFTGIGTFNFSKW